MNGRTGAADAGAVAGGDDLAVGLDEAVARVLAHARVARDRDAGGAEGRVRIAVVEQLDDRDVAVGARRLGEVEALGAEHEHLAVGPDARDRRPGRR